MLSDRYRTGNNYAFEEFYSKYKDKLYGFICSRTYPELADDIIQEAFRKFINAVFEKKITDPKNYLFTIVVNTMKDRGKNKFKDSISYADELSYNKVTIPEDILNFETEFDKVPELDKLKSALKKLSVEKGDFYNVLHLHVYSGFTFDDIATIENLNRNTVSARYMYALKYLKRYYSEVI